MAGLDDYHFYMAARQDEESPFWERRRPPQRPSSLSLSDKSPAGAAAAAAPATPPSSQYLVMGANLAGLLAEHVLAHPFVVLRRQCQVNAIASRYHLSPVTLVPVLYSLNKHQGLAVLWKGLGSSLIVKGLRLAAEDVLSKLTPWPKELGSGRQVGRHLLLKFTAAAFVCPFAAVSLAETVQSEVASERPGVLDVLTEGACRAVAGGRLLPVWLLAPPLALYSVAHYVLSLAAAELALFVHGTARRTAERRRGAVPRGRDPLDSCYRRLAAATLGGYLAELLLYPADTVLSRLQLQGTRSIVDNLDTGCSVLPISSRYEGVRDCAQQLLREEGVCGLYRGVGALLCQAALHAATLYASHWLLRRLWELASDRDTPRAAPPAADQLDTGPEPLEPEQWRELRDSLDRYPPEYRYQY